MNAVVIGMDSHKRSATIEVMACNEAVLDRGRYGTDASGYRAMLRAVRRWQERTGWSRAARAVQPTLRARLAMRAIWPARFAGGPFPGEGSWSFPAWLVTMWRRCAAPRTPSTVWTVSPAGAGGPPARRAAAAAWPGAGW